MKKKISKSLALILSCALMFGTSVTAFAAEDPATPANEAVVDSSEVTEDDVTINFVLTPAACEAIDTMSETSSFRNGTTLKFSNVKTNPKFVFWARGDANCKVEFKVKTPLGANYTPGAIFANGSTTLTKQYIMLINGDWEISAAVAAGYSTNKAITCYVDVQ